MKSNLLLTYTLIVASVASAASATSHDIDQQLRALLQQTGFSGKIESTLTAKLGRPINPRLADLGRLLFFDVSIGLHNDNACGGCHSPYAGLSDSQSIAIGVQSNRSVGPGRIGPRNQRRAPSAANTAFYPKLMWNGRFSAPSGSPFDNSLGFLFPPPEGATAFPPNDSAIKHLLQAHSSMRICFGPPAHEHTKLGVSRSR